MFPEGTGAGAVFAWEVAKIATTDLDEVEKAKLYQKLVTDAYVRLIHRGAEAMPMITELSKALMEMLDEVKASGKLGMVGSAALQESRQITTVMMMLAGNVKPCSRTIDGVWQARASAGTSMTQKLRNALAHSAFWREKEKKARSYAVAAQTLQPEIDKLDLANTTFDELVTRVVPRIPVWEEGLLPGLSSA